MGGGSPSKTTTTAELPKILQKPGQDYISQIQQVASQGLYRAPIYKTVQQPIYGRNGMITGYKSVQTNQIAGYQPADLTQAKAPVYGGQRYADLNADQTAGMGMIRDAAQQNAGDVAMARGQFGNTANGAYMGYSPGQNGYLGATTNVGYNPMLGLNNPYLAQAIDQAQGDVTRNYTNAVMPQADAAFARSGAFGGSAWQQAQSDNSRAMAGELGRISTNMRMQDYGAQQGLYESAINRDVQTQQNDLARNAQLAEAGINRSDAAYQQERARQMSAAAALPGLAGAQMQAGQSLYNSGAKQQDYQQRNLDYLYQQWQDQINEPQKRLEILQNGIGTILGAGANRSQSTSGGSSGTGARIASAGLGGLGTYAALSAIPGVGAPLAVAGGLAAAAASASQ